MPKTILILVGDYVEDYEAMVPFQTFLTLGYTVHAICPGKKAGDFVKTCVHDFEGDQTYSEKRGHNFVVNLAFDDVTDAALERYDGIYIPGGRAPEYLRMNPRVVAIVQHFGARNKPIASICHGPQILAAAGLLKGRQCTAYPALEIDCIIAGASWVGKKADEACVDGNLVTSPAWPGHPALCAAFIRLLGTTIQ
ncbi:protease I [Saprolegnia diclina VS20]|uniref:Protease I n=1 Tax=Saprolegnia diclina (strain VS20) TaxID=1156394 RepID=T0QQU4_SAPDV|nr:protease I [Saprolegnia diclina VS20]EQC40464.1 protease I [Saprolegnia diclina VS20]|eukprot:XP_008606163.1 protease I [Saprolegnia diclina VS20]